MKDKTQAQLADLAQTRLWVAWRNEVNDIFSACGVNLRREAMACEKILHEAPAMDFDAKVKVGLEMIVEDIRGLNLKLAELEKTTPEEGSKLKGQKNRNSIQDIDPMPGSILLSVIGDAHGFGDESKLAAYVSIVAGGSQSNQTGRSGRITKCGSKLGRTALVPCAVNAQRYSPCWKQSFQRTQAKKGAGKAIIDFARKVWGIVHRTLKNNSVFEDFQNFVPAETV